MDISIDQYVAAPVACVAEASAVWPRSPSQPSASSSSSPPSWPRASSTTPPPPGPRACPSADQSMTARRQHLKKGPWPPPVHTPCPSHVSTRSPVPSHLPPPCPSYPRPCPKRDPPPRPQILPTATRRRAPHTAPRCGHPHTSQWCPRPRTASPARRSQRNMCQGSRVGATTITTRG